MNDKVAIQATLIQQKFYNSDNHWGVFYFSVIQDKYKKYHPGDFISAKGNLHDPMIGKIYDIKGVIDYSPTWGESIVLEQVVPVNKISEKDYNGKRYILAKLFPKHVDNMYEALDDPYEALKNKDYQKLVSIKGCGMKTAVSWTVKFEKSENMHKTFIDFAKYGFSDHMLQLIIDGCNKDTDKALDLVKNHPYQLMDIKGIGWKIADDIAITNGLSPFDEERIQMCIKFYLRQQGMDGKSYSKAEDIMEELMDKIGEDVPDFNIASAIRGLRDNDVIVWNDDKTEIGLAYYYNLESKIADHLLRLMNAPNRFDYSDWERIIEAKERQQGWNYTSQQIEGIKMVLENQVCCISGYGGTGKTSIIDGLLTVLSGYKSITVALAGRAASRIAETTGEKSMTIHMLLGLGHGSGSKYDFEENPLPYDIIVVDEISMISGELYYQLLKSIESGTKVIFIGDVGQLESIGSCAVAADMIDSPFIPSIFLDIIHRQAQKSAIITESIKVRKGLQIISENYVGEEVRGELKDLTLKCFTDKSNTYHEIVRFFKEKLKEVDNIMDLQIIVPNKQGVASVFSLNRVAQEIYNPIDYGRCYTCKAGGVSWSVCKGDKVINRRNAYDIKNLDGTVHSIFNGNLGIVQNIGADVVTIDFQGIGVVDVPKKHMKYVELGYAITCHSAQGSQFPVVIGGIDFSMYIMLNKELLYTMITRASKEFILVAQNEALSYAVKQHQISNRQTYLLGLLEEKCCPKKLVF